MIRLRRPPTIRVVDEPFVPNGLPPSEVDRRWRELCDANPRLHDGRSLHVLGVHRDGHGGATIHVVETSYRYYAINVADPTIDTLVRPLGVKGITTRAGATAGSSEILVGRRASWVASDAGRWELAPGGAVERDDAGRCAPDAIVRAELREETGLEIPAAATTAIAIAFDPSARSWEIVYRMRLDAERSGDLSGNGEYDDLRWWPIGHSPPTPMSAVGTRLWALAAESAPLQPDESDDERTGHG